MKNISTLDLSLFPTNIELSLKSALDIGFRGEFDPDSTEGLLRLNGIEVAFSVGGENLYFSLPEVYVKSSPTEGITALAEFLKVFANYGGQANTGM